MPHSQKLEKLFVAYSEHHRNPTNQRIHFIAVPVIAFCLIGLLAQISIPGTGWNTAFILLIVSYIYYWGLSRKLMVTMVMLTLPLALWHEKLEAYWSVPPSYVYGTLFVLAWIAQFVGHKIEGKRPSFFEDLQFLLVGPIWLLGKAFPSLYSNKK